MANWETLLGITWPNPKSSDSLCDQSGECCRGAAQYQPWKNLIQQAANGDSTAKDFLNQFIPYPDIDSAKKKAPDAVTASLETAQQQGRDPNGLVFYHCRYLEEKSTCLIYEDRPTLCREFPESPFGSIPTCCGYKKKAQECLDKITALNQELTALKST